MHGFGEVRWRSPGCQRLKTPLAPKIPTTSRPPTEVLSAAQARQGGNFFERSGRPETFATGMCQFNPSKAGSFSAQRIKHGQGPAIRTGLTQICLATVDCSDKEATSEVPNYGSIVNGRHPDLWAPTEMHGETKASSKLMHSLVQVSPRPVKLLTLVLWG